LFPQFFYSISVNGLLPSPFSVSVLSCFFSPFDSFSLPLPNNISFELSKRSQHLKEEPGERILCAVVLEGQPFLVELYGHALSQQRVDQVLEILKTTGKPIDRMYPERVSIPEVLNTFLEGGPVGVLAAGLVLEYFCELLPTLRAKLPGGVLVCAAYSKVGYVSGHSFDVLMLWGGGEVCLLPKEYPQNI